MQKLRLLIAESNGKFNIMLEQQLHSSRHRVISKVSTQIANHIGYRDPRAFARSYKRRYGILPSEVLRNDKGKNPDP